VAQWHVIGSGPSGHGIDREQLSVGWIVCVNTAVLRIPLDLIDFHLFRTARRWQKFPELVAHDVTLVTFRHTEAEGWPPNRRPDDKPPAWAAGVEILDVDPDQHPTPEAPVATWKRGTYSPFRDPVGPQAVQFCVNNGADLVHLRGLEGGDRGHDGLPADEIQADAVRYHAYILQAVVNECPDVTFIQYGKPLYRLVGPNVEAA